MDKRRASHNTSPIINPSTTNTTTGQWFMSRRSSRLNPSLDDGCLLPPPLHTMADVTAAAPPVAPPYTHATKKSSLATFLIRDIKPNEGQRLLLPFLTTMGRLHLSECSKDLLNYRYHLSQVKIVHHPSHSLIPPDMRRGLKELLARQQGGGGLEYLRVQDCFLLDVLDLPYFARLKTLEINMFPVWPKGVAHVERALVEGRLANLEELDLFRDQGGKIPSRSFEDGDRGVRCMLVGALGQGVCPKLRRLNLGYDRSDSTPIGDVMVGALEMGHLKHLQDLNLAYSTLGEGGGAAIARALQGGACPDLVELGLRSCRLTAADGQALGSAMSAGACAKLEVLDLNGANNKQGLVPIFESLAMGNCPNLKRLHLVWSKMDPQAATALGHALRSGYCQYLQYLDLTDAFSEPGACLHVLQAIRQGMPNLLHLSGSIIESEHGRVLGAAIGGGALPRLTVLSVDVPYDKSLGDGGVVPIMAGLEGGGCPHLKELFVGGVGMGPQGGQALGRALASGHLSCLQTLGVGDNKDIGNAAMKEVMVGLKLCHQLRVLHVRKTGMGREAGGALWCKAYRRARGHSFG